MDSVSSLQAGAHFSSDNACFAALACLLYLLYSVLCNASLNAFISAGGFFFLSLTLLYHVPLA